MRAYAVHALEVLFAAVLARGFPHLNGIAVDDLVLDIVAAARSSSDASAVPQDLRGLLKLNAAELTDALEARIEEDRGDAWMEPELARALSYGQADDGETIYTALLLFLLALARMRTVERAQGLDGWLGGDESRRLPPRALLSWFDAHVEVAAPLERVAAEVLRDLVIRQHVQNAFRKLEADPRKDTSRFVIDGNRLVVHNPSHPAGSSYPRYGNAVLFLRDLRYIGDDGQPTEDGHRLVAAIEEGLG